MHPLLIHAGWARVQCPAAFCWSIARHKYTVHTLREQQLTVICSHILIHAIAHGHTHVAWVDETRALHTTSAAKLKEKTMN